MTSLGNAKSDDELFEDLFDDFLQRVLDGDEPDLDAIHTDRPELRQRIAETYDLACDVAARRRTRRPMFAGYEIVKELGRGGMGTVFLARHEGLGREVALKVLPQLMGLSGSSKQRFLVEARALAKLRHDNIVRIHHIIERDDVVAYEMEWVDGFSLREVLDVLRPRGTDARLSDLARLLGCDDGALGATTLAQYFVQLGASIARALEEVHRAGLVHRDVKPSNILLRRDGKPLLADFGLAKGSEPSMTRPGAFVGTVSYAPPEQLRSGGESLDGRVDVYSLGATLFEAFALSPPFSSCSTTEVLRDIESGRTPLLRRAAPHVSRDLETIVAKAMEPDPVDRYVSAAAFADDLERLLQLRPIRARPIGWVRRIAKSTRRHRRTLLAGAVGALLVAGALFPVFGEMRAAGPARERSEAFALSARLQLLSLDNRSARSAADYGSPLLWRQGETTDPLATLRDALSSYDKALDLSPRDARIRLERDVVRMVLWLRTKSPREESEVASSLDSPDFARAATSLPSTTALAARQLLRGKPDHVDLAAALQRADGNDRLALGLMGFLLQDLPLCELGWSELESADLDYPLLDAGLGLCYHADGRPERAYPRLFHAIKAWPESRILALELADVALAMGDVALSRRWLEGLAESPAQAEPDRHLQRVRADLLVAEGQLDAARQEYERLAREEPSDPTPAYRLAQLAAERGDITDAEERLRELSQAWPHDSRFRLGIARLALLCEDLPAYLAQACYVVRHRYGAGRPTGAITDLLEILRAGGLRRLYAAGVAATGVVPGQRWRGFERPVQSWAPRQAIAHVEEGVETWARWRGIDVIKRRSPYLPSATELPLVLLQSPPAVILMGPGERLTVCAAAAAAASLDANWHLFRLLSLFSNRWRQVRHPLELSDADGNLLLGFSLGGGGDVNGDGVPDVVVGNPPRDAAVSRGSVTVASGMDGSVIIQLRRSEPGVVFGHAVADAGDVDADGRSDVLVGAPRARHDDRCGMAWVFSGRDGTVLHELRGELPGFGASVDGVGDLDRDGHDDVVVGTSPSVLNSAAQGWAAAYSGRDGSVLRVYRGDRAGVWFGSAVSRAGDVDGDGYPDVVIGGNRGGAPGLVRVYSGQDGAELYSWVGGSEANQFGRALSDAGDVDGDGHDDILVGAPSGGSEGSAAGEALLFSGENGSLIRTLRNEEGSGCFGSAVAGLGDIDGDGRAEVSVGAPDGGPLGRGCVLLIEALTGTTKSTVWGAKPGGSFGSSLAQVSRRGIPAIAMSGPETGTGTVCVLSFPPPSPPRGQ